MQIFTASNCAINRLPQGRAHNEETEFKQHVTCRYSDETNVTLSHTSLLLTDQLQSLLL